MTRKLTVDGHTTHLTCSLMYRAAEQPARRCARPRVVLVGEYCRVAFRVQVQGRQNFHVTAFRVQAGRRFQLLPAPVHIDCSTVYSRHRPHTPQGPATLLYHTPSDRNPAEY